MLILNLANSLTIARGALALLAIALVQFDLTYLSAYLLALFVVAVCTDYLDGVVARATHTVSDFGKIFDPLFDKVLVFAYLIILYPTGVIPPLIILLLIVRDLVIDALRSTYASKGVVVPAIWSAKAKTATTFLAITSALLEITLAPALSWLHESTFILSVLALLFAYVSAAIYVRIFITAQRNLNA